MPDVAKLALGKANCNRKLPQFSTSTSTSRSGRYRTRSFSDSVDFPISGTLLLTNPQMQTVHDSQNLFLEGPAGHLEAILWTPVRSDFPLLAAVVCHPHPLFG